MSDKILHDIIIIGAGPVGLSFAKSLADSGLNILILEKQPENFVAEPKPDGREIALTHLSKDILTKLGIWQNIPENEISPLKEAKVVNGDFKDSLHFESHDNVEGALGFLIPNYLIRKAIYDSVAPHTNIKISFNTEIETFEEGKVTLKNGEVLEGRLIVAADSRFSEARKQMGINAKTVDFKKNMMVLRVEHEMPHNNVAHECFLYDKTMAILPLPGNVSSAILTISNDLAEVYKKMTDEQLAANIESSFEHKYGKMKVISERYSYPLIAVYADRFYAKKFVLLGDSAVGMHPVTAHGFNFGLRGQNNLASLIKRNLGIGYDIADEAILKEYNSIHRAATLPLYLTTNGIVKLYTDTRPMAKTLRKGLLKLSNKILPIKNHLTSKLTEKAA